MHRDIVSYFDECHNLKEALLQQSPHFELHNGEGKFHLDLVF